MSRNKKTVMILGASRYYIHSIIKAKEMGLKVLVIDKNPNAEGFKYADYHEVVDITDIENSIEVAKKYQIAGVVALNDFGVLTQSAIANELNLVGITPEVAKYVTNKALMRKIWQKKSVPSPKFRIVKTLEEAYEAIEELNTFPLVVKPADSRGGGCRGVRIIRNKNEIEEAVKFAQSFYEDKTILIEEFINGIEHSLETITYNGETYILAISDKVKVPPPYRVDKSVIYPTKLSGEKLKRLCEIAKKAVQALGITVGAAHVELCTTNNGPKLFEVGARCGGGATPSIIVPFLTGIDMIKEVIRIHMGEEPERLKPKYIKGCVYRFITPRPGIIKKIHGLEEIKRWKGILDCELFVKEGDKVNPVKIGKDRSGFIVAGGETREEAIKLADKAEKALIFEYEGEER